MTLSWYMYLYIFTLIIISRISFMQFVDILEIPVTHLTDTMVLVVCCTWTFSIKLLCSLSVCSKLSEDRRMRG